MKKQFFFLVIYLSVNAIGTEAKAQSYFFNLSFEEGFLSSLELPSGRELTSIDLIMQEDDGSSAVLANISGSFGSGSGHEGIALLLYDSSGNLVRSRKNMNPDLYGRHISVNGEGGYNVVFDEPSHGLVHFIKFGPGLTYEGRETLSGYDLLDLDGDNLLVKKQGALGLQTLEVFEYHGSLGGGTLNWSNFIEIDLEIYFSSVPNAGINLAGISDGSSADGPTGIRIWFSVVYDTGISGGAIWLDLNDAVSHMIVEPLGFTIIEAAVSPDEGEVVYITSSPSDFGLQLRHSDGSSEVGIFTDTTSDVSVVSLQWNTASPYWEALLARSFENGNTSVASATMANVEPVFIRETPRTLSVAEFPITAFISSDAKKIFVAGIKSDGDFSLQEFIDLAVGKFSSDPSDLPTTQWNQSQLTSHQDQEFVIGLPVHVIGLDGVVKDEYIFTGGLLNPMPLSTLALPSAMYFLVQPVSLSGNTARHVFKKVIVTY